MLSRSTVRLVAVTVAIVLVAAGCRYTPLDTWSPGASEARAQINALLDEADVAEANGDDASAEAARAAAAEIEAEIFLPSPAIGATTVLLDPTLAGGFFDAPWPSDSRLRADGSLDLSDFPGRSSFEIADIVIGRGEADTFGFGTNSAVYFRASGELDLSSVPDLAESTIEPRSTVLLLDLDDPTAAPVPVLVDYKATGTPRRPSHLLAVLPYPGHPLRPSTRYGAAVFNGLRDADGFRLAPSPTIEALDGSAPAGVPAETWAALRQDRDDVIDAVRARTLWRPADLVAFAAFTTQATTSEMDAIAAAVAALPEPEVLSREPTAEPCVDGGLARSTARVALPIWQAGTRPFVDAGGNIEVDGNGLAVQQGVELGSSGDGVLLDVAIPCGPAPEGGWPLLVWIGGTGAVARAAPINELGPDLPYAVVSIAPLYSGDRLISGVPVPFNTSDFQFFNYGNPLAARTNAMQQAADVLYIERLLHGFEVAPDEAGGGIDGRFDLATVVFGGHSQGATTLPLTLAYAPGNVQGAYLSASGAGLYHSIVYRADVRSLVENLIGAEPGELDVYHPYPQLLQTFAEPAEPANYAAAITTDVVMYGGLRDGCTAIEVSTHLATALGIPIANPQTRQPLYGPLVLAQADYDSPFEPSNVVTPVSQNLPGGRTGVVVQVDSGHFGARTYPAIGRSFVDSIAAGGPSVVDPGPTPPEPPGGQCPRFGAPPIP
ncbi:MAG: hypothetical protein JJU45_01875 [Acidimicrobiia bacterium]|nr:hypothetical protein [Acidimicrobiia bacterium]